MDITHPMLGVEGRTSTSANHLANLAKEYYQNLESQIKNQSLVTKTVTIVGQNNTNVLINGITDLTYMKQSLREISQCKALIAYLREGIKAKKALIDKISDYISEEQKEHSINRPSRPSFITDEDVINSWPLEKRMRYYSLEARAATYGQFIHPGEPFSKQRETFHKALSGESEIREREHYVLVYKNTPTVALNDVESIFFDMQNKHREAEAELNSLKTEIQNAVQADKIQKEAEYKSAIEAYNAKTVELVNRDNLHRIKMNNTVSKYKIIIPDNLKDMVAKIENL
jgi:hypothetical protein